MTTANDGRRYSAFISYRHHAVDRFQAIALMRALEAFSTPPSLRKQGYPAKLDPVFRDDDEAGAHGSLSAQLQAALTASSNLIVMCSPRTAGSEWVLREIEFFQQLGRGDRIIPVVIEGEPGGVVPAPLRSTAAGWESGEMLAVDLRPHEGETPQTTLRRGILRIAAAALECKYDDLAQRAEAERRRARFRLGAIAGAGVALAAIAAFFVWDANWRIKDAYYANYIAHWGVPVGVGRLSDDEVRHRTDNTRISTQGGRVIAMATVNSLGTPHGSGSTDIIEPWSADVARWTYSYRGDGTLANATAYDQAGLQVRRLSYDFSPDRSEAVFRIENGVGRAELFAGDATMRDFGVQIEQPGGDDVQHSNVGQHRLTFDSSGLAVREIFEPLQGGSPVADANGVAGRAFAYDHDGNLSEIRNLGLDGRPDQTPGKAVLISFGYDRLGQIQSQERRSASGVLVAGLDGVARITGARDRYGNQTERRTFDANGAPVGSGDWGAARQGMRYDQHGNLIEAQFFGVDGRLANVGDERAAIYRFQYDDRGRVTETAVYGADSTLIVGYGEYSAAIAHQRYDAAGRVTEASILGPDRRPSSIGAAGATTIRLSYDAHGNVAAREFFGADGARAFNQAGGFAIERRSYDDQNRMVSDRYYGLDGAPIINLNGVAGDEFAYDSRGNRAQITHIGTDGRPQANMFGTALERYTYDDTGRLAQVSFFNAANAPTIDANNRAAIMRFSYDAAGHLVQQSYFGVSGEPVAGMRAASSIRFEYDASGAQTRVVDLDASGNVIGFTTNRNDARGRPLEISAWLGNYSAATLGDIGDAHIVRLTYDQHGQPTTLSYFDTSGAAAPNNEGVTQERRTYNDRGRMILTQNFNAYGAPAETYSRHSASERYEYDLAGRLITTSYYDAAGRLLGIERLTRDAAGHVIQDTLYDGGGARIASNGISMQRFQYNAQGRCLSTSRFDAFDRQIDSRAVSSNDQCRS